MNRFCIIFLLPVLLNIQTISAQNIRGLYVNGIDAILFNEDLEQELFDYIYYGDFNSLSFYSLYNLDFKEPAIRKIFRSFIRKAREKYGVQRFGGVSESAIGFFDNIHHYNDDSLTLKEDRLDHYNIEFEFWSERATSGYYCEQYLQPNGYPCTPEGALQYVVSFIEELRQGISPDHDTDIEMYVGWLTETEAQTIAPRLDRILVAVYQSMNKEGEINLYNFAAQRKRLEYLAKNNEVNIVPIFSNFDGSSDDNLNEWLNQGHTICEAWNNYESGFIADQTLPNKENITLEGFQWFKYSSMPVTPMNLATPGPIFGPDTINTNETKAYLIPENQHARSYEWYVFQDNISRRYVTPQPSLKLLFKETGQATLQVRTVGCGEISPVNMKLIVIEENPLSSDVIISGRQAEFEIRVQNNGLQLIIPPGKKGPFHVQAFDVIGKQYLSRTLDSPGQHFLKFSQIPDSTSLINVSIIHPGGAFSKKISIFEQPDN